VGPDLAEVRTFGARFDQADSWATDAHKWPNVGMIADWPSSEMVLRCVRRWGFRRRISTRFAPRAHAPHSGIVEARARCGIVGGR